ncbi:MAG: hypothetical protein V1653_00500, partial [bacterium]
MNLTNLSFQPVQWWIAAIFILGAIGVMIFYFRQSRKIPLFLRLFLFLLVLLLLLQPARNVQQKLVD